MLAELRLKPARDVNLTAHGCAHSNRIRRRARRVAIETSLRRFQRAERFSCYGSAGVLAELRLKRRLRLQAPARFASRPGSAGVLAELRLKPFGVVTELEAVLDTTGSAGVLAELRLKQKVRRKSPNLPLDTGSAGVLAELRLKHDRPLPDVLRRVLGSAGVLAELRLKLLTSICIEALSEWAGSAGVLAELRLKRSFAAILDNSPRQKWIRRRARRVAIETIHSRVL